MKRYLIILFLISIFHFPVIGQVVYEPVANNPVYDLLDELATLKIISINSAVKPYSRVYIAEKLKEADQRTSGPADTLKSKLVSKRLKDEIRFYLRDYAFELGIRNEEPERSGARRSQLGVSGSKLKVQGSKSQVSDFGSQISDSSTQDSLNNNYPLSIIHYPLFNYDPISFNLTTKPFKLSLRPTVGARYIVNENSHVWDVSGGGELFGYVGKHIGYYVNVKQTWQNEALVKPEYFTLEEGKVWRDAGNGSVANTEWRGGVSVAWKWGDFGVYKDRPIWGNGVHGTNILSGHAPPFPFIQLHVKPAKWIEFWYIQGMLTTDYFKKVEEKDTAGKYDVSHQKKFIVANMVSVYPWKELSLSVGNSIIYTSDHILPAFLIPDQFFKATDQTVHTMNYANAGYNNQLFIGADLRLFRHLHVWFMAYIEDIKMSALWAADQLNELGYKTGFRLSNFPFRNLFLTAEYTRTNPLTYRHLVVPTEFYSGNYCLGDYMRDDSQEIFISLCFKPYRTLQVDLSYNYSEHGIDYLHPEKVNNYLLPFIGENNYQKNSVAATAILRIFNNLTGSISYAWQNVKGDVKYSPEIYLGRTNTLMAGIKLGF